MLDVRLADARLVLRVDDDGPGGPPSLLANLFEPFNTGRADGTGLGLALAREVALAHGGAQALALIAAAPPFDAIFLDHRMPGMDGLETLAALRDGPAAATPVMMLTVFAGAANTIDAMRLGAFDHVAKPVRRETLRAVLDSALSCRAAPAGEQVAQPQAGDGDLVGHSEAMREVHKRIGLAAASALPVLVLGETGTGKEVVARALHRYSARAARPFIAVNCAAIPGELLESELFGHVRGAFTGATSEREGCFRAADGGVLLLDEIGDMPLDVQAKILRRTAAAGPAKRLAADAEACLLRQAWPGNARELRNAMERCHALFRHEVIGVADLASILDAPSFFSAPASTPAATPALPEDSLTQPLPLAIERLERRMLEHALVQAQGNRAEAARRLCIHR